ncbi:hypothetical protein FHQ26_03260 [Testudinibacter sp. TR-2022]|uniref:siderophore-interacting protein n=1 Tax=Testudinibacter sp. TR-2022 TaxID=2585029 RepID=UPI00111B8F87|nr:siderophore-interacting protein [Testudinibacter sp. TR-2022]TNH03782.1 hypothetical protein FHQ22_06960 [Pasteurellaceae bacterium Phil31]TNH11629.1 hypothetical protein FHQ26_03260 [Testudinibacter sp. TR-2022]TNH11725.1 hypothetical protein FHQ25_02250 [Testudinibacter sp. TR-2022]TNH15682.1 hypothetical protein FIA56_02730 [Testudinibacter sp. TR-2022]TNH20329.1 hypothetical protein FHQ23_01920 [Testudinibacter sp. TR-2022]
MKRTPLADQIQKIDIIEHVTEDHYRELLAISRVYLNSETETVNFIDLFEEGMLLTIQYGDQQKTDLIPFLATGEIHHKVRHLAMTAIERSSDSQSQAKHQFFDVLHNQMITKNICRLTLKSSQPLPIDKPGYAWNFSLTTFDHIPDMAELKINEQRRYYTLRQAKKSSATVAFNDIAFVDVFLHGNTPGSVWSRNLQQGDIIHSAGDYNEKTDHLEQGNTVLIADETSLPTVAWLLENWKNPLPPTVISITHQIEDQDYLNNSQLPENSQIHHLHYSNCADNLLQILETIPQIDSVWGAFEHHAAKIIRQYLRTQRKLDARQNRVKGYWIE